jgi:hypothetical protein
MPFIPPETMQDRTPRRNTRSPWVIFWMFIGFVLACIAFSMVAYVWLQRLAAG